MLVKLITYSQRCQSCPHTTSITKERHTSEGSSLFQPPRSRTCSYQTVCSHQFINLVPVIRLASIFEVPTQSRSLKFWFQTSWFHKCNTFVFCVVPNICPGRTDTSGADAGRLRRLLNTAKVNWVWSCNPGVFYAFAGNLDKHSKH